MSLVVVVPYIVYLAAELIVFLNNSDYNDRTKEYYKIGSVTNLIGFIVALGAGTVLFKGGGGSVVTLLFFAGLGAFIAGLIIICIIWHRGELDKG